MHPYDCLGISAALKSVTSVVSNLLSLGTNRLLQKCQEAIVNSLRHMAFCHSCYAKGAEITRKGIPVWTGISL